MTGDELKQIRKVQKISRRVLAERCGLHPDTIRYWENKAQINYTGHGLKLIVEALGLPPEIYVRSHRRSKFGYFSACSRAGDGVLQHGSKVSPNNRCGARTRSGTLCQAKPAHGNRRCKFHGGMSTGPKSPKGRQKIAEAQRKRWKCKSTNQC